MKNKLLLVILTIVFSSSLSASSFMLNDINTDRIYYDFHKQMEKFFSNKSFDSANFNDTFLSYPKMDMIENEKSYTLKFELAGMDKKNIKVSISQKNILNISGTQDTYTKEDNDGIITRERHFGSFNRSVLLPNNIDRNKIDVKYKNGILNVKVAKDMKKVNKNRVRVLPIN